MLTEKEKELIANAATDLETGHHLLMPRSQERIQMLHEVCEAITTDPKELTERQKEICEEYRLTTDYSYWLSKHPEELESSLCPETNKEDI